MSVFQTREFARYARKAKLTPTRLWVAAEEVRKGDHDADLGGGVFKQRVARQGGGKSGGFRTILLFRRGKHIFFAHGFAKNEKANVSPKELKALKRLADILLSLSSEDIEIAIEAGELIEVVSDDGDE